MRGNMPLSMLYYKIIPIAVIVIIFSSLYLTKKFRLKTIAAVFSIVLIGLLGFSNNFFMMYFICLMSLGLVKKMTYGEKVKKDFISYSPKNFFYNCIPSLLAGLISFFGGMNIPLEISASISLGTVLSDTVSSDVGVKYKGATYLITDFSKVPSGTDGGISLIGSLAGLLASVFFALMIAITYHVVKFEFIAIAAGLAFGGNLIDSLLGALLQNKGKIDNEEVNFVSVSLILIASLIWIR
jgi:uncharacterized protein (TIGR00297 family)